MVTRIRRSISLLIGIAVLGLSLGLSAAPAQAATTFYVDDSLPACHAGAYPTIQAAVIDAGAGPAKVIVCPGTYNAGFSITNADRIKVMAKKNVFIQAPPGFTGDLIAVYSSTNITIQGFNIDGMASLGSAMNAAAINFQDTSGTVAKNKITRWREANLMSQSNPYAVSIFVGGIVGYAVKVTGNTITDYEQTGIVAYGEVSPTITKNTLSATRAASTMPVGIHVEGVTLPSRIQGNKLLSDGVPSGSGGRGIEAFGTSNMTMKGNTISGWSAGLWLRSYCSGASTSANNNVVSGNKISEAYLGIVMEATAAGACHAAADNNKITSNKITNSAVYASYGIQVLGIVVGLGTASLDNEMVKGNKITHFTPGQEVIISPTPPGAGLITVSGVFGPNKIVP